MMQEVIQELEKKRIQEVALDYTSKGYDVIIEPTSSQLPDFLATYQPNILARGQKEIIIVEVKSRTSLTQSSELSELAGIIKQHPGYRLELVVANTTEGTLFTQETTPLNKEEICEVIQELDELSNSEHSKASFLLAWATVEAALRLLAQKEGIPLRRYEPLYLLKQLATYAVISKDEYESLMRIMKIRNALAHGYKTDEFKPDLVQELIDIAQRILQSVPDPAFA